MTLSINDTEREILGALVKDALSIQESGIAGLALRAVLEPLSRKLAAPAPAYSLEHAQEKAATLKEMAEAITEKPYVPSRGASDHRRYLKKSRDYMEAVALFGDGATIPEITAATGLNRLVLGKVRNTYRGLIDELSKAEPGEKRRTIVQREFGAVLSAR